MRHATILNARGRSAEAIALVQDEKNGSNLDTGHISDVTMMRRGTYAADPSTLFEVVRQNWTAC